MPISSAGLGSGLDVNGIVSQLMQLERQPLTALGKKEAGLQAKLSAYGSLKGALSAFQGTMRGLASLTRFQALKTSVADSTILSASAATGAVPGGHSVEVKQLAQAHTLNSKVFTNTTDTVGTGTLTVQYGTYSGSFTANADKASQTVTIGSGQSTLGGIRDAINAANIGVTATILNDGTGNRLVLVSKDTGAANSLKITVSNDGDSDNVNDAGLSQLAYDPAGSLGNGKNLSQSVAAQNATLKVNGIDNISKASNTVTDAIQGVTLMLLKLSASNTPTTVTVTRDTDSVKTAVKDFADAYNYVQKNLAGLTAYDAASKKGAILQGDASALSMLSQVRAKLNASVTGLSGAYTLLSQIGVSFQKDGTLAVDSTKLQTALDTNFDAIAGLFANQGKPSDGLVSYAGATGNTKPGTYSLSVTQLATQGYLNGATTASLNDDTSPGTFNSAFVINADNDALSVTINGKASGVVTLAQGSYTTAAALTAEIQSKINGDSVLKAAGVSVIVSFDTANNRLVLSSANYGSDSTVAVTSEDPTTATTLGFSIATGTTGVNVAGTLNGAIGTGTGQYLTGATGADAEGLRLLVAGGATGSRGTVNYSQGYAYQLDKLVDQLLGDSGPIASRTKGINASITDIGNRRSTLEQRLLDTEKRYRAQFTALDGVISRLRTTNDFLTRQLAVFTAQQQ